MVSISISQIVGGNICESCNPFLVILTLFLQMEWNGREGRKRIRGENGEGRRGAGESMSEESSRAGRHYSVTYVCAYLVLLENEFLIVN